MPIEILESIIRINVLDNADSSEPDSSEQSTMDAHLVVKECVEQVLEILKEKEER